MVAHWSACVRPVVRPSVFSFPDDNLRKYQWIFTNVCTDSVEIWFLIANEQISLVLDRVI